MSRNLSNTSTLSMIRIDHVRNFNAISVRSNSIIKISIKRDTLYIEKI